MERFFVGCPVLFSGIIVFAVSLTMVGSKSDCKNLYARAQHPHRVGRPLSLPEDRCPRLEVLDLHPTGKVLELVRLQRGERIVRAQELGDVMHGSRHQRTPRMGPSAPSPGDVERPFVGTSGRSMLRPGIAGGIRRRLIDPEGERIRA